MQDCPEEICILYILASLAAHVNAFWCAARVPFRRVSVCQKIFIKPEAVVLHATLYTQATISIDMLGDRKNCNSLDSPVNLIHRFPLLP